MKEMMYECGSYAYKEYRDVNGTVRYIACLKGNNSWHYQQSFETEDEARTYCQRQQRKFEVSYIESK